MKKVIGGLVMALVLTSPIGLVIPGAADAQEKKVSAATAIFEVYKDKGGDFRFRLKDSDGNLLAIAAKGYEKKADCQKVIEAIKKDAAKAKVEDVEK